MSVINMNLKVILPSALLALFSISVSASGGFSSSSSSSSSSQRSQVDQTYEVGKDIFNGRQTGTPKISYCVSSDGETEPVKTKTISAYKRGAYDNLAQNLYNCDKPDTLAANELSHDDLLYVLYYLNKRYSLSLRGA